MGYFNIELEAASPCCRLGDGALAEVGLVNITLPVVLAWCVKQAPQA